MSPEKQRVAACCALIHDVAAAGNDVSLVVHGASMIPSVWPGDQISVRHGAVEELHPGQIILFHRDGKLTAHRILNCTSNGILTRGDSINCLDLPVQPGEIVGRVESIRRGGRTVDPVQKLWQRGAAWVLRHSEFAMRVTLYFARRLRRTWDLQPSHLGSTPFPSAE